MLHENDDLYCNQYTLYIRIFVFGMAFTNLKIFLFVHHNKHPLDDLIQNKIITLSLRPFLPSQTAKTGFHRKIIKKNIQIFRHSKESYPMLDGTVLE